MTSFTSRRTRILSALFVASVYALTPNSAALAKQKKPAAEDSSDDVNEKAEKGKKEKNSDSKTLRLGTFGEWGAYQTQGKSKTCYALAKPKSREPKNINRDPAYVFISNRPTENVKNEISIIMGFPMKDGSEASAEIGSASFSLLAKGANAWVKNPAEEGQFIGAMKKGSKLVVKAASSKGKTTTDTYVLSGLGQALDRVHKECQ